MSAPCVFFLLLLIFFAIIDVYVRETDNSKPEPNRPFSNWFYLRATICRTYIVYVACVSSILYYQSALVWQHKVTKSSVYTHWFVHICFCVLVVWVSAFVIRSLQKSSPNVNRSYFNSGSRQADNKQSHNLAWVCTVFHLVRFFHGYCVWINGPNRINCNYEWLSKWWDFKQFYNCFVYRLHLLSVNQWQIIQNVRTHFWQKVQFVVIQITCEKLHENFGPDGYT